MFDNSVRPARFKLNDNNLIIKDGRGREIVRGSLDAQTQTYTLRAPGRRGVVGRAAIDALGGCLVRDTAGRVLQRLDPPNPKRPTEAPRIP